MPPNHCGQLLSIPEIHSIRFCQFLRRTRKFSRADNRSTVAAVIDLSGCGLLNSEITHCSVVILTLNRPALSRTHRKNIYSLIPACLCKLDMAESVRSQHTGAVFFEFLSGKAQAAVDRIPCRTDCSNNMSNKPKRR